MSKFKEWKQKHVADASGQHDARDTWLAAMREAANLVCETCQAFGHAEVDEETGEFFHDTEFEDESICNADTIHQEIDSVEKGE